MSQQLAPTMRVAVLSGVDVKIDNTRLWFPSGHPAYVKANKRPALDSLSIEVPCAASGSPTALRRLRFLRLSPYLIAISDSYNTHLPRITTPNLFKTLEV